MFAMRRYLIAAVAALLLVTACESEEGAGEYAPPVEEPAVEEPPAITEAGQPPGGGELCPNGEEIREKWDLWACGTRLRGANLYQRRVYPELDGPEFMGPGPVGPPVVQADFDRLAALGANYVNLSHPGLFTENPPYEPDPDIEANLDRLIEMAARADLFVVISFRTGPGRAEFGFMIEDVGDWFDESYLNDSVWEDRDAQAAWAEMWRYTAERYRHNPVVAGYDLMVEPNAGALLFEIYDPEEFYASYAGTTYDWNQFYPPIVEAIREVDPDTPLLVGAMGHSAIAWLPYLQPTDDPRTVYTFHQYEPIMYTHQEPGLFGNLPNAYPGEFDLDWDGEPETFDRGWLEDLLTTADGFRASHGVPVAVNEFGVMRWEPGAAAFMDDEMAIFEELGLNYALWEWEPSWEPLLEDSLAFNFRLGPDPDNRTDPVPNDLTDAIVSYWERNSVRPSNVGFGTP